MATQQQMVRWSGMSQFERNLARLATTIPDRVMIAAAKSAVRVVTKGIKSAAAVHKKTGGLFRSIGGRVARRVDGSVSTAKSGVGLGKLTKKQKEKGVSKGRHGHLVGLGTKPRQRVKIGGRYAVIKRPTPSQLSTGTMPADDFVKRGYVSSYSEMQLAMAMAATKTLTREAAKLRT